MSCTPQKSKWAAARTIQLAQKLGKLKNLSKPNVLREMKGIWEKSEEIWKVRKITTGESQVEYYFLGFPKGRNYFRGIGDTLHFSKTKVSSSQNHPTRSETGKKCSKTYKSNASHRELFGGKWREYGRNNGTNMTGGENNFINELSWIPFRAISQEEKLF